MKPRVRPLRVPNEEEILTLLAACGQSRVGVRNRALITILWRCGLRVSEALALSPSDLDRSRGTLGVRRGKGGKSRTVGVDQGTIEVVDSWLALRPEGPYLFSTLKGAPLWDVYVRAMLARLARKAKIPHVHPHSFRHSHAAELARESVPLPLIQRALGHSSLQTTATYLESLGADEAAEVVRGRTWIQGSFSNE